MVDREKEILEMPIQRQSEYFLNTILNDSASDLLSSSSSESDSYSETSSRTSESSIEDYSNYVTESDNEFVRAYNNLYTRWINLHR